MAGLIKKKVRVRGKGGKTYMRSMSVRQELKKHGKSAVQMGALAGVLSAMHGHLAGAATNRAFGSRRAGYAVGTLTGAARGAFLWQKHGNKKAVRGWLHDAQRGRTQTSNMLAAATAAGTHMLTRAAIKAVRTRWTHG